MWQFLVHHVVRPPLWTWVRLNRNGSAVEKSKATFSSYRKAFHNATQHGFNPRKDSYETVEGQGPK